MGTPDYMAPEQAEESHTVDIRADIYSLGCTLYFLLAGHAPFAGGTLAQKLRKHMLDEPPPIEGLRHDLPPELPAVLRRMMAKRPEDRYQTPLEVAEALVALARPPAVSPAPTQARSASEGTPARDTVNSVLRDLVVPDTIEEREAPLGRREEDRRQWRWIGIGAAVLAGLLGLFVVLLLRREHVPEKTETPPAPAKPEPRLDKPFDPLPQRWLDKVAGLKPAQQVQEVKEALKLRNPDLDTSKIQTYDDGKMVSYLYIPCDGVTDLTPVLALSGLTQLLCNGSEPGKSKLRTLPSLEALVRLEVLYLLNVPVSDLTELEKLPRLHIFMLGNTRASDLKPLAKLPLQGLYLTGSPVKDLTPLAGLKGLNTLLLTSTRVEDLSPLREVPLETLSCDSTPLKSLAGVEKMPLKGLGVSVTQIADLEPLRGRPLKDLDLRSTRIQSLEPLRGMKLRALDLGNCQMTDLSPVEGMPLEVLSVTSLPIKDLKGLVGPKLTSLDISLTKVTDLTPLKNARAALKVLNMSSTAISNLEPLQGMPLEDLRLVETAVQDLSVLRDMPTLRLLWCHQNKITDLTPLRGLQLQTLRCDYKPDRDREVLRSIKTLETINGKPAAEFLK
jgi:Leucine-rich repeat (LRR) protein